jgi:hypothetical protein
MTLEQAKAFIKERQAKRREELGGTDLNGINSDIEWLRNRGFYVTVDGTNQIIGNVMMDGKGNPNFSIVGEVK